MRKGYIEKDIKHRNDGTTFLRIASVSSHSNKLMLSDIQIELEQFLLATDDTVWARFWRTQ